MSYQRVLNDLRRRERLNPEPVEPEGASTQARPASARNVGFAPLPRPEPVDAGVYYFGGREMTEAERWAHGGFWHEIENSSNVSRIAYDKLADSLYIEFTNWLPGQPIGYIGGRGSIYRYAYVSLPEAISFYNATSAGVWVWDELRVRGTWSGHKKPYSLTGRPDEYLPRYAVEEEDGEWFKQRYYWEPLGSSYRTSQLPDREAPSLKKIARIASRYREEAYGIPDTYLEYAEFMRDIGDGYVPPSTAPNRATPNRGSQAKPNRGK